MKDERWALNKNDEHEDWCKYGPSGCTCGLEEQAIKAAFIQGFATAVADLVRAHDQPTIAAGLIAGANFVLKDFRHCDEYDRKVIRKLFRTESILGPPAE